MKHTTNYNLNKIDLSDSPPDITALNPNFDTIDAELKRLTDKDAEIVASVNTVKNDYLPKTGGNITNALKVKNKTVAVSVNGSTADANGNITIDVGGKVQSVNGVTPDANGNVAIEFGGGDVQSVDGVRPDENGNVALNASTRDEILEATKRVTDVEVDAEVAKIENLQTSVSRVESNLGGVVRSINNVKPDDNGNVTITHPVTSVNGQTGEVTITHPVTSVNGQTGEVTITVPPTPKTYVTTTWKSGNNWYKKWSDGFIEQGGIVSYNEVKTQTITFNLAFTSTPKVVFSPFSDGSAEFTGSSVTKSNFAWRSNATTTGTIHYYACGY